jgi:hypothetical protein
MCAMRVRVREVPRRHQRQVWFSTGRFGRGHGRGRRRRRETKATDRLNDSASTNDSRTACRCNISREASERQAKNSRLDCARRGELMLLLLGGAPGVRGRQKYLDRGQNAVA